MNAPIIIAEPLVSIVIPCFNHGAYLSQALDSIYKQSYRNIEIVVVDDGSTDNTKQVAENSEGVKYYWQENQGLSAARNTGIDKSTGAYLVFLDADDWLLEGAVTANLDFLIKDPGLAFVSGAHVKVLEHNNSIEEKKFFLTTDPYRRMLQGNFIAMHASVMYCRWVFNEYRYDTSLKALEDYDIYLRVMRKYRTNHHQYLIAAYRIHEMNMSGNIPLMLSSALRVLELQKPFLKNDAERRDYNIGIRYWTSYYSGSLYIQLNTQPWHIIKTKTKELRTLYRSNLTLYLKLLFKKMLHVG